MAKTLRPAIVLKGQKEARVRRGWASEKLWVGKWSAHGQSCPGIQARAQGHRKDAGGVSGGRAVQEAAAPGSWDEGQRGKGRGSGRGQLPAGSPTPRMGLGVSRFRG